MAGQAVTPEQQLVQLRLLLSAVHRTRTALPRLVATVSSSSSSSGGDRTSLYRTAHQECHAAIAALQDQLDLNARPLEHAQLVAPVDPPLLFPLPPPPTSRATASWDKVRDILQTTITTTNKQGRPRSPPPPPPPPPLPIPTTPADLQALVKTITQHDPRVHIRVTGSRQLEFSLRGVLRAHISLRWEDETACQADYVACYSLMEDPKPSHVDSQFALFRSLSNQAMNMIDQSRRSRTPTAAQRSLEQVLLFLCDPPLPF